MFGKMDIHEKKSGLLGENLSGGQRQVINIIGGLIQPSEIVILDEPTNSLDIDLKREIINLIKNFKKYKKCIIIITHDKDVFPIFDENIKM
jgi:ABC-type lipoprotein export system ATPase subunit